MTSEGSDVLGAAAQFGISCPQEVEVPHVYDIEPEEGVYRRRGSNVSLPLSIGVEG